METNSSAFFSVCVLHFTFIYAFFLHPLQRLLFIYLYYFLHIKRNVPFIFLNFCIPISPLLVYCIIVLYLTFCKSLPLLHIRVTLPSATELETEQHVFFTESGKRENNGYVQIVRNLLSQQERYSGFSHCESQKTASRSTLNFNKKALGIVYNHLTNEETFIKGIVHPKKSICCYLLTLEESSQFQVVKKNNNDGYPMWSQYSEIPIMPKICIQLLFVCFLFFFLFLCMTRSKANFLESKQLSTQYFNLIFSNCNKLCIIARKCMKTDSLLPL